MHLLHQLSRVNEQESMGVARYGDKMDKQPVRCCNIVNDWALLWSVSFNSQSTFKKYIEMLKIEDGCL